MRKIKFKNATLVKEAYVTIDGTKYEVTPRQWIGGTQADANQMNKLQDNVEEAINEVETNAMGFPNGEIKTPIIYHDGDDDKDYNIYINKIVMTTNSSTNGFYNLNDLNIRKMLKFEGSITQPNKNVSQLNYYLSNTDYSGVFYDVNATGGNKGITWRHGSSYGFGTAIIKLVYTKEATNE